MVPQPDRRTAVSEENRSRLYAWWCEHADDSLAEYVMSRLAPGPLGDLVTKEYLKEHLSAEFAKHTLAMAAQREADRAEQAAQREADRAEQAAQREADRAEFAAYRTEQAAQRKADGKKVVALGAVIVLESVAAEAGWLGSLLDLLSAAL